MVWNMFDFFTMYAEVDGWEWGGSFDDPMDSLSNPLDRWIVSRIHQLNNEIAENMERYDIPSAMKPILPFLDDASNWYVRRSRRRFWKSEDDNDKNDAYRTLHYLLLQLSMLLAPFTPFLAEELFLKLTGGEAGESVHLLDWPKAGKVDKALLLEMAQVREYINQGLSLRAGAGIKVRQPLTSAKLFGTPKMSKDFQDIVAEELNVKMVELVPGTPAAKADEPMLEAWQSAQGTAPETMVEYPKDVRTEISTEITPELRREGMMREVVRQVQNARKQAGLNIDDRIRLAFDTHDEELKQAVEEHADTIKAETLATELTTSGGAPAEGFKADVKVEGVALAIALSKAG